MATSNARTTAQTLRLSLAPFPPGSGMLDGAWWPRTREIDREVAELVDQFPPSAGRISRVLFSRPDWSTRPRQVRATRGLVKTGSFPGDDTHVVVLNLYAGTQLTVLVVPPATRDPDARSLMAAAVAQGNRRTATELLGAVARRGPEESGARWSDDGGAS